jgi:hypothetical protein
LSGTRGARPARGVLASAARNYRCVLGVLLLVGIPLSLISERQPLHTYRATKPYLVAGGSANNAAVITGDTDRVARDYAAVLRSDDNLLDELAAAVHRSRDSVAARLQVGYVTAGSTIFVRYEAARAAEVKTLFTALDEAVTRTTGPSPGVPVGFVRPLGTAQLEERRNLLRPFPGAAALGSLLLGFLVAVVLERSRGRVLHPARLRGLTDHAVLPATEPEQVQAVLVRALMGHPERVVVATVELGGPLAQQVVAALSATRDDLIARGELDPGIPVVPSGPPGPGAVTVADAVVLVATPRTALRSVRDALQLWDAAGDLVLAVFPERPVRVDAAPVPVAS